MAVRMEISGRLISLVTCLRLRLFLVRLLSDLGNFHTAFAVATEFSCDNSGRGRGGGWMENGRAAAAAAVVLLACVRDSIASAPPPCSPEFQLPRRRKE